ncbi:hypothetical protein BJ741DRAFT_327370 [Chytriomyces cf. hyalinus JEL632]|nr:hypothetical protein BJ741DRAFT_327370 [Chytriomyces cf. hyalinus JEL632]
MLLQALTTVALVASSSLAAKFTWYGEAGSPGYGSASGACGRNFAADDFMYYAAFTVNGLPDKSSVVNSGYCGRCLQVSAEGSAVVMITDVMMREDADVDDVDLSPTAFSAVAGGGLGQGIAFGSWSWADCGSIGGGGGGGKPVDPAPVDPAPVDPAPVDPAPSPSPDWVEPTTTAWVEPTTEAKVEPVPESKVEPSTTESPAEPSPKPGK